MLTLLALGFASGLPLALTASTLSLWLSEAGVTKAAIGLFAAVATPYALKFLWAPAVDALPFPMLTRLLGRRRGWLIGTQCMLALSLIALGFSAPAANAWNTAACALAVAFFSATQDIVMDAWRVELLPAEQQGNGAAMFTLGYRLGMIASGAGALYLATDLGWEMTYVCMAALLGVGTLAALLTREIARPDIETEMKERKGAGEWLYSAVIAPFAEFMTRPQWLTVLLFIFLYKFGDAFIGLMSNPFYREIGFEKTQIADIAKLYGLLATIIGAFVGGALVSRFGILKILWIGGIAQASTNLLFILLAQSGPEISMLALAITADNLAGGIATSAFVAYLSSLCNLRYTATQYALLSSLSAVARTLLSTPAGWVAESLGWANFFALSALMALPGLAALWLLTREKPQA